MKFDEIAFLIDQVLDRAIFEFDQLKGSMKFLCENLTDNEKKHIERAFSKLNKPTPPSDLKECLDFIHNLKEALRGADFKNLH